MLEWFNLVWGHVPPGMAENDDAITAYLANNPRMIGALFTMTLLLSQAGSAAASVQTSCAGP